MSTARLLHDRQKLFYSKSKGKPKSRKYRRILKSARRKSGAILFLLFTIAFIPFFSGPSVNKRYSVHKSSSEFISVLTVGSNAVYFFFLRLLSKSSQRFNVLAAHRYIY